MPKVKTILLVCTGNSCRSVMAGGLLKKLLKDKGDYTIATAGTASFAGMPPTHEAIQVMSDAGIDVSDHRSSALSNTMIEEADLILVMERRHKEHILNRLPGAKAKVYLLTEFGRTKKEEKLVNPDIPDPIGKPLEFYRNVFDVIREGIVRTARELEEEQ